MSLSNQVVDPDFDRKGNFTGKRFKCSDARFSGTRIIFDINTAAPEKPKLGEFVNVNGVVFCVSGIESKGFMKLPYGIIVRCDANAWRTVAKEWLKGEVEGLGWRVDGSESRVLVLKQIVDRCLNEKKCTYQEALAEWKMEFLDEIGTEGCEQKT